MKKTLVMVLALVLVVSLSLVAFVACNDDDKAEKASNSEVLGTTVAVLASNATGALTSADDNADVNFNAGVNIKVGDNNELSVGSNLVAIGIGEVLQPMIQQMVDRIDNVLSENGVKVEKVDSEDAEYTEKYAITVTYVDEESGEQSTYSLALYVKLSEGAEIEGTKDYTFDAKVKYVGADGKEIDVLTFGGKANFDTAKDAMVFSLGASAGDTDTASAFAGIKAYATAQGTIKIEMGAGAGVSETLGANAALSVEIGKLADGKYGAVVTVQGTVKAEGIASADFVATINVYANSQDNAGEFVLSGNVKATVAVPVFGTYEGTADLTGKAVYDADKDEAVVGLNGTINFAKVETENK